MSAQSESSAKYKVGDVVWFENELWRVGNINDEPHVSLSYDLDAWGAAVKRKAPEDMLDPADEAGND